MFDKKINTGIKSPLPSQESVQEDVSKKISDLTLLA